MFNVSVRSLKIISAIIWYIGGIVLVMKGSKLLFEADYLNPNQIWTYLSVATGLLFGGLRAKSVFSKSCRKNLERIDALAKPKIWQFFKPWFFVALLFMIAAGSILSRMAHNNYAFLLCVATLDFSIASALIGSSYIFWRHKIFFK